MSNDTTIKISNIISIIESELKDDDDDDDAAADGDGPTTSSDKRPNVRMVNMGCSSVRAPPVNNTYMNDERDEIFFAKPTFAERFARYFVIVIYLCGLCSLGFILSIYHIFIWDSRMPPIYKPAINKKPLIG